MASNKSGGKEELRKFLVTISENFQQYHTRKENLAWLATTLYLGAILGLISLLFDKGQLVAVPRAVVTGSAVAITITCILTLAFIRKQLADRTFAAHILASCNEVLALLLDRKFILKDELSSPVSYKEAGHVFLFPKLLVNRLKTPDKKHRPFLWNYTATYVIVILWTTGILLLLCEIPSS